MNRTKHFPRALCLCLPLLLMPAAAGVAANAAPVRAAPRVNRAATKAEIKSVAHPGVRPAAGTDPGTIGNVQLRIPGGGIKTLTTSGLACDAKTIAKGKAITIGWIEGQILPYPDRDRPMTKEGYPAVPTFFPKYLVVLQGNTQRRIVPEKLYLVVWKFFKDGKQVGIQSQGSHGPTYLQLFDTSTGKLLESHMDFEKNLPEWTRAF